jgi:hydroxylamine reductase
MTEMFCFQCEQTAKGTGCTIGGVCGKKPEAAGKHDELTGCANWIGTSRRR